MKPTLKAALLILNFMLNSVFLPLLFYLILGFSGVALNLKASQVILPGSQPPISLTHALCCLSWVRRLLLLEKEYL